MSDSPQDASVMSEVLGEILEKFVYMFVDPVVAAEISPEGIDFLRVEMGFSGPSTGRFVMLVPQELCGAITANILGFEQDDEFVQAHLDDGARELLNIVGAHVLTRLHGEGSNFSIGIPEVSKLNPDAWGSIAHGPKTVALMGDSKPVVLQLVLE